MEKVKIERNLVGFSEGFLKDDDQYMQGKIGKDIIKKKS